MNRKRTCHISASSKDFTARPFREICVQRSCLGTPRLCQSSRVINAATVCMPTLLTSYLSTHAWSREPRTYRVYDRIRDKNSTWSLPDTVWGRELYFSLLTSTSWRLNHSPHNPLSPLPEGEQFQPQMPKLNLSLWRQQHYVFSWHVWCIIRLWR